MSIIKVLEYFSISLVSPRRSVKVLITGRNGLLISFLIVLLSSVIVGVTLTVLLTSKLLPLAQVRLTNVPVSGLLLLASITAFIVLGLGCWIFSGLLIHISCKLLRGGGRLEDTLIALSHLWMPLFLLGLVLPVFILLSPTISVGIYVLLLFILTIWGSVLAICALSEVHRFSTIRALLSTVIILVIILVLAMLLALSIVLLNIMVTIESVKF